jgi:hypothetical protein
LGCFAACRACSDFHVREIVTRLNPIDARVDAVRVYAQRQAGVSPGWRFVCEGMLEEHLAEIVARCPDNEAAIAEVGRRVANVLVRREK